LFSFPVQEDSYHTFYSRLRHFKFPFLEGEAMNFYTLLTAVLILVWSGKLTFHFCHYWVQKYSSFFNVQLQNLMRTFDALAFVILCKHLWRPSCTTLSVSQIIYDSVKRELGYLQLFFEFSNGHSPIFMKFRLNLFLEIVRIRWPPTSGFINNIRIISFENSLYHFHTFLIDIKVDP